MEICGVEVDDGDHWNFEASCTVGYGGPLTGFTIEMMIQLQSTHRGDKNNHWIISFEHLVMEI